MNKKQKLFYYFMEFFTGENSKKDAIKNFNKLIESPNIKVTDNFPEKDFEKISSEFKQHFDSKIDEIFTDFDEKLAKEAIQYVHNQIYLGDDKYDKYEKFIQSTSPNYFNTEIKQFLKSKNILKDWRIINNLILKNLKKILQ